jgi:hypothetical protein
LSVSEPADGKFLMMTAESELPSMSLNPKSVVSNVLLQSSLIVRVEFAPVGASLTGVTLSVMV